MKYVHGLKFDYPSEYDQHMIAPKQTRDVKFTTDYPYYNKNFFFRFLQTLMQILFVIIVFPVNWIRYGTRVINKKVLRKYKKELKDGYVTVCNHVYDWDYLSVRNVFPFKKGYMLVWKNNHNRSLGKTMRAVGSVPVPDNFDGIIGMTRGVNDLLQEHKWLHVYPEQAMWYYYQDLRPFKKGTFTFACRNDKPVIPLAISFRPAKGIRKLWKKNYPLTNISVGEPIFPDHNLDMNSRILKQRDDAWTSVHNMIIKYTPEV